LADRLEKLIAQKLAEKYVTNDTPARNAYRLTNKGKTLRPVLEAVAKWGLANIVGTEAKMKPKPAWDCIKISPLFCSITNTQRQLVNLDD